MEILETRDPTLAPACVSSLDSKPGAKRVEARTVDGWWEATKVDGKIHLHALREPTAEKIAAEALVKAASEAEESAFRARVNRRAALRGKARSGVLTPAEITEALSLIL